MTVGRSDYGIYLPILRRLQRDPELALQLIVAGMHLSPEFGLTVGEIETDGFEVTERVEMLLSSDTPAGIAASMGLGTLRFGEVYARRRPDLLVVLGDRFEMHAAALAALPFKLPVAHIHGGEITEGAFDDALRHSMTKLSHLHFVATEEYRARVVQMGEEPWRVVVSGAPSLDTIRGFEPMPPGALAGELGLPADVAPILVTYHPVTLESERTEWQVRELLQALRTFDLPMVFTGPNADTGGRIIAASIETFLAERPLARFVTSLGTRRYLSLLAHAAAMVGNSSSGIVEAPSFGLPVVNVGTRQAGRVRAANVIDVGYGREEIARALTRALAPEFRAGLTGLRNPYGDGHAAEVIVKHLKEIALDDRLVVKRFADAPALVYQQEPV